MFKFKRNLRKKYKTERGWLTNIYRQNKEAIEKAGYTKEMFIKRVLIGKQAYPDRKLTTIQSLKELASSQAFTPYKERAYENVIKGLKSSQNYKVFRELTKDKHGRYTKLDTSKFKYEGDDTYSYGNVIIEFRKSPEEVIVRSA